MSEICEGLEKYKPPVSKQLSHRDEMYNMGNIVNNTVIILYDDRWQRDLW